MLGTFMLGSAYAADVKSIAILTPEEGTDYGWNQQGVDAAKAAAEADRRPRWLSPRASATAMCARRRANWPATAPA